MRVAHPFTRSPIHSSRINCRKLLCTSLVLRFSCSIGGCDGLLRSGSERGESPQKQTPATSWPSRCCFFLSFGCSPCFLLQRLTLVPSLARIAQSLDGTDVEAQQQKEAETRRRAEMQRALTMTGAPHTMAPKTLTRPTFCNCCSEFIWGVGEAALCCDVCTFYCHHKVREGGGIRRSFLRAKLAGDGSQVAPAAARIREKSP